MKSKITLKTIVSLTLITLMSCNQRQVGKELSVEMLNKDLITTNVNSSSGKTENSEKTAVKKKYSETECENLLDKLIRESDFNDSYLKTHPYGYVIMADQIDGDKALLQLKKKDEKNHYTPDGWFELDFVKSVLYFHGANSDKPLEIKFNKQLLDDFRNNCSQLSED